MIFLYITHKQYRGKFFFLPFTNICKMKNNNDGTFFCNTLIHICAIYLNIESAIMPHGS
jgi:hypothetical protein